MFRELRRKNRELTKEECEAILQQEKRGVLSVIGDEGYPYGMPMNYYFDPETQKLYFHCNKLGHRLESLRKCNKASFCVMNGGEKVEGEWGLKFKSVIAFGKIEICDDEETIVEYTTRLSHKFTRDEEFIQDELRRFLKGTLLLVMTPDHLCGKWVIES